MKNAKSVSHDVYSDPEFVDRYAAAIIDNPWNAYYERPATLSLLPDVSRKTILDAGCGPGIVSEILINRGAIVTSVDYSSEMIKKAKARIKNKGNVFLLDLNDGLDLFNDAEFDIIYSSLMIHYIDDIDALFGAFSRILKPNGYFIFSTDHPNNPDFLECPVNEKRLNDVPWSNYNVKMHVFERPWSEITGTLINNGFEVETVIEPKPTEECKVNYPKEYKLLTTNSYFICVRAKNIK